MNDDGAETQGDDDGGDAGIASVGAMIIFASFVALFPITSRAWIIDLCALLGKSSSASAPTRLMKTWFAAVR